MEINIGTMNALTARVNTAFNKFLTVAPALYQEFSIIVPSTAGSNIYPRMSEIPGLREWVGERVVHELEANGFEIRNRTFEETISARREDLEDDQFHVLTPAIQQLGYNASVLPDELVFDTFQAGATKKGWDGQYYFDQEHQTYDENGKVVAYSNLQTPQGTEAAGPAWYALVCDRPLKPMIYQTRRPFVITAKTSLQDGVVFSKNRFMWGVDGRCNAGLGMWQLAMKSTRPLNVDTWAAVKTAFASLRRRDGAPYGLVPTHLLVPSNLETQGKYLLNADFVPTLIAGSTAAASTSNPYKGDAKLMVCPRLSQSIGG